MGWVRNLMTKVDTDRRIVALEADLRAVQKAYGRLEHDSEEMWETVRKALGRVSRLKRDVDSGKLEPAAKGQPAPQQMTLSPADQRLSIYRSARNAVSTNSPPH